MKLMTTALKTQLRDDPYLLLHEVARWDGNVEDGHTGAIRLALVDPRGTDVISDVRVVAAGEAEPREERKGGNGWRCDEAVHVHVVLERELGDGVAGSASLDLHRAPSIGDVHELGRRQVVLRDVHRPLELRVGCGLNVQGK